MPFELLHFRDSESILKKKKMMKEVTDSLEYMDSVLSGAYPYGSLLKQCLIEKGWRENGTINILPERKYFYKGFKQGVAIEGNLSVYEFLPQALFRMQVGHDHKKVDVGILLVNSLRGEKTPYGSTKEMVESEIEVLEPTISLPVTVALFDLV